MGGWERDEAGLARGAPFVAHPPPGDNHGSHCSRWRAFAAANGRRCPARIPRDAARSSQHVRDPLIPATGFLPSFASPKGGVLFRPRRASHKHGALSLCYSEAPKADASQVVSRTPRAAEHQPQSTERPPRRIRHTTPRAANDHPEGSGSPPPGLRTTTPKAPAHHPPEH